eukprot:TRINITY_DN2384_c0_g2_i1.p1 TRINITY_DN2384_c0_g2~~TRINITY_DN2384_c0_g2_i1.p1  ORF type:complete len:138 (-),score=22.91 TRINITY_DN2384_c0_g2_i1:357-770(-)
MARQSSNSQDACLCLRRRRRNAEDASARTHLTADLLQAFQRSIDASSSKQNDKDAPTAVLECTDRSSSFQRSTTCDSLPSLEKSGTNIDDIDDSSSDFDDASSTVVHIGGQAGKERSFTRMLHDSTQLQLWFMDWVV